LLTIQIRGQIRSSTGTRITRSTTVAGHHQPQERRTQIDSTFSPKLRMENDSISSDIGARAALRCDAA
jgi:hypothetical protein